MNGICHRFRWPKQFLKLLNFEHTLCHSINGSICTLWRSNVLGHALNVVFHRKNFKIFWIEVPSAHPPKCLDFMLQLLFYKCLKLPKPFKSNFLWISSYKRIHTLQNIINKNNKIFFPSHGHGFHEATNPKCTISKGFVTYLSASLPSFAAYCLPSVHALQTNLKVEWEVLPRFMPLTILWSA